MSFDILFVPTRCAGKPTQIINPFKKGEMVTVSRTLSSEEATAVRNVLSRVNAHGPDDFGCYNVELADGGSAEVYTDSVETGCVVELRGITPDLIQFLYDLGNAATWVMVPVMEDLVSIATSEDCIKEIPVDLPRPVVCNSANEIGALLAEGVQAWQKYRDQVVSGDH
jgi:hypothetical protein